MTKAKKRFKFYKNKFVLITIALLVWVLFFDKNDLKTLLKSKEDVRQLEAERDYYKKEIKDMNREIQELTTNPEALEKFAREKYLMKRDNEDIFIIVEDEDQDPAVPTEK